MGTSFDSLPNIPSPIVCTTKWSPMWGITPTHGPRWAAAAGVAPASGFGGAGFFAAGLMGEGLAGEGLGVGAVWARAGCATASASNRATVRITAPLLARRWAPLSAWN